MSRPFNRASIQRILPNPIFLDENTSQNVYYFLSNNAGIILGVFSVISIDYTPDYDEETTRVTLRFLLHSRSFNITYTEHNYRDINGIYRSEVTQYHNDYQR